VRAALVAVLCAGFAFIAGCEPAGDSPPMRTAEAGAGAGPRPARFGFGSQATAGEIARWDIDVRPDGAGLPAGRGTAQAGQVIYQDKCAVCHGASGTEGPADRLVGREPLTFPFGTSAALLDQRTIGNYWPYATTLFDFIRRAMPQTAPGSLTSDEVYALVAFLLSRNGIIGDDTVMDASLLPQVVMPARDRFVTDDRRGGGEVR